MSHPGQSAGDHNQTPAHSICGVLIGQRVRVLADRRRGREMGLRGGAVVIFLKDLDLQNLFDLFG
jgi:hypothetical protein